MTTRLWLVFEHGKPVVFHGLFKRKRDAEQAYRTERENLHASGNAAYADLEIQPFTFESFKMWSSEDD